MHRWTFHIGHIAKIPIRAHIGLVPLLALGFYFNPDPDLTLRLARLIGSAFLSLFAHELTHALVARRFGIETHAIYFHPFGGAAVLKTRPETPKSEAWIALSAPLVNLSLALLAALASLALPHPFIDDLLWVNLLIGAANLLPAFPLDGGRVFRALLSLRIGARRATFWAARLSRLLASAAIIYGLWQPDPLALLFGALIFFSGIREARATLMHLFLRDARIFHWMAPTLSPLQVGEDRAQQHLKAALSPHLKSHPVLFGDQILGLIPTEALLHADGPLNPYIQREATIHEGDGLLRDLLQTMQTSQSQHAIITHNQKVCGVLTPHELSRALHHVLSPTSTPKETPVPTP